VFGGLALLLACVGIYGLLAFSVAQRTAEIGIRTALGAQRAAVMWLVMREALVLVGIGVAVGVPAALMVARRRHGDERRAYSGLKVHCGSESRVPVQRSPDVQSRAHPWAVSTNDEAHEESKSTALCRSLESLTLRQPMLERAAQNVA